MMMHSDLGQAELGAGMPWALEAGAALETHPPQADVRVLREPDGRLFCLFPGDRL